MGLFRSTCAESHAATGFDALVALYSEPHRYYHNLHHVYGCLHAYDQIADRLTDPFCIESAIWFHDVIYNPKGTKNEDRSAEHATGFLSATDVNPKAIVEIDRLIRLTRHPSNPSTDDEKYLIDIDLATLGAAREQYDQYEVMIRKEYAYVPGLLYKRGRRKLLTAFLDCPHIYRTRYFRDRLETRARANIKRALGRL